jgi:hypothetical protein
MLAILQMGDTPQIESTAVMLRHAGYEVKVCGPSLRNALQRAGCDTVISVSQMVGMGYDTLERGIDEASPSDMETCDLFVEIKIRNVQKIWNRWPRLKGRVVYWRVNGSQPEICPKGGDEVNLICPIITACLWYGTERYNRVNTCDKAVTQDNLETMDTLRNPPRATPYQELLDLSVEATAGKHDSRKGMCYTFWPPYPRSKEYDKVDRSLLLPADTTDPYCMCYVVRAWGYGEIISEVHDLGVKFYGDMDGRVEHARVSSIAATAKALVHMKSVDCPGWALYEAMLAGCPVIIGKMLNARMLAYELLEDGVTCLEFGVPCSLEYGRGPIKSQQCLVEITEHLKTLEDPIENYRLGQAGRKRLNELMWNTGRDGDSFIEFMRRWFG